MLGCADERISSRRPCPETETTTLTGYCTFFFFSQDGLVLTDHSSSKVTAITEYLDRFVATLSISRQKIAYNEDSLSRVFRDIPLLGNVNLYFVETYSSEGEPENTHNLVFGQTSRTGQIEFGKLYEIDHNIEHSYQNLVFNFGDVFRTEVTMPEGIDDSIKFFLSPVSKDTGIKGIYFELNWDNL